MKKKKVNDCCIGPIIGILFFLNIVPFLMGIIERGQEYMYVQNRCDKPVSKIEYIIPGFQLGCYLGKPF